METCVWIHRTNITGHSMCPVIPAPGRRSRVPHWLASLVHLWAPGEKQLKETLSGNLWLPQSCAHVWTSTTQYIHIHTNTWMHIHTTERVFTLTHRALLYFNFIINIYYNVHNQVSTGVVVHCYTLISQLQFGLLCLTVCAQLQKSRQEDTQVLSEW